MRASALVVALVLVGVMLVSPADTYTTGIVDRPAEVDVAADETAVVGLDIPSTEGGSFDELVTITNNFDTTKTFTVTLKTKRDTYNLYRSQLFRAPDSLSVTLAPGESATIYYRTGLFGFPDPTGDARFSVTTSGDMSAELSRVRSIQNGRQQQSENTGNNGNGNGNGNGNNGNGNGNACNNPGNGPSRCQ
jgi:hypothetical protein